MSLALEISGLTKTYPGSGTVLNQVDLNVEQGDFFALLGPNGAGKSTLISIISSLVKKQSGRVKIGGLDIDAHFSEARRQLGVVPQEFNFNVFEKVRDVLVTQAGYFGVPRKTACERADYYLQKLGLWEKRNEVSRRLSGGMKRRLMIARALVHEPSLLVLDEPTAGVDIELRLSMWDFIQEINQSGTTIILTTHYLEEAENLCRNVAIINQGEIIQNSTMASLLASTQKESFILDIDQTAYTLDLSELASVIVLDKQQLEIQLNKGQALNPVFKILDQQGVKVLSIRNKTNRLEELFVELVGTGA